MENFRADMACGVPALGLPVLAPLTIASAPINVQLDGLA